MNTDTDARRAYVERILNRLRQQYADRTLLPSGAVLSLPMLQRLMQKVISEGYGL